MDLTSGFQIATIRGIAIRVHWSWAFIFALLTWSLSGYFGSRFPEWSDGEQLVAAVITSLAFFLSVLLHELSHALVAQGFGMPVPSITLFIFGGVSNIAAEMRSARQEFLVAGAGPAMSFLLGVIFLAAGVMAGGNVGEIIVYLGTVNVILGVFNMLPGFPLDGGRLLRSVVWSRTNDLTKATRIASMVGVGIAWTLIGIGAVVTLFISITGLWYVFIGFFLKQAAEGSYQQLVMERALERVKARDMMRPPPDPLPDSSSLQHLVDVVVLARGDRCILLEREGRITGLITTTDLAKVDRDAWSTTSARTAMVPADQVATVGPDAPAIQAVRLMVERDIHQVPVLDEGRLVGLLTRGDVINHMQNRVRFGGSFRPRRSDDRNGGD